LSKTAKLLKNHIVLSLVLDTVLYLPGCCALT